MGILEATRYAPSCFNEQPWRFVVAKSDEGLKKMRSILVESNQVWANNALVLILILSKKDFGFNNNENYWHMFGARASWGYMSLEAQRRGLITHAMGGFSKQKTKEVLNIGDKYSIIAVVAVGKLGDKEKLPEDIKKHEVPGNRKSIQELIIKK